jgi:hypothetical protein
MDGDSPIFRESGWNVGNELHFQQSDMILQLQFPLFQASQLQLVAKHISRQKRNHGVKVPVLDFEFNNALLDVCGGSHVMPGKCENSILRAKMKAV